MLKEELSVPERARISKEGGKGFSRKLGGRGSRGCRIRAIVASAARYRRTLPPELLAEWERLKREGRIVPGASREPKEAT